MSVVFDGMRKAQSICVFVFSIFDEFHAAVDSVAAKRGYASGKIDPS